MDKKLWLTLNILRETKDRLDRHKLVPMESYDYLLNRLLDKISESNVKSSDSSTKKESAVVRSDMSLILPVKYVVSDDIQKESDSSKDLSFYERDNTESKLDDTPKSDIDKQKFFSAGSDE